MEAPNLRLDFRAQAQRLEPFKFIKVSEGKHRFPEVLAQLLYGIYTPHLGREEGKMEVHHCFSILKEKQDHNFHSGVLYCHESFGKSGGDS